MDWPIDRFKNALRNINKILRHKNGGDSKEDILAEGRELLAARHRNHAPLILD